MLETVQQERARYRQMIRHFDCDSNGFLDLDELVDMWFRKKKEDRKILAASYENDRKCMWDGLDSITEFKRQEVFNRVSINHRHLFSIFVVRCCILP